jgi:hypothetical protein
VTTYFDSAKVVIAEPVGFIEGFCTFTQHPHSFADDLGALSEDEYFFLSAASP